MIFRRYINYVTKATLLNGVAICQFKRFIR
jgi:hypothetical protein